MTPLKVYITTNPTAQDSLKYIWHVFALNKGIDYFLVENKENADLVVDETVSSDILISLEFHQSILSGKTNHTHFFHTGCRITDKHNRTDYLSTAFYMINSLQEYNSSEFDQLGRFKYINSYQYKFNAIQENEVQKCFDELVLSCPKLSKIILKPTSISRFLLSHDIDSVQGAITEDSLAALKQIKPWALWRLLFNAVFRKPDWLNMDKIMKMESEYDYKSVFFWLVNQGRVNKRETNADYNINKKYIKDIIFLLQSHGYENGLHKSISTESFSEEINKMPVTVNSNRYHYLKFKLPEAYHAIDNAGLKIDASLGFAEAFGFRNNYGQPFSPYDFKNKKAFGFIEMPLNVMDGTFQRYMKVPVEKTADLIISFFEKNKYNCVISILWHNTFFSNYKYKGYTEQYKKILDYLYNSNFKSVSLKEILKEKVSRPL